MVSLYIFEFQANGRRQFQFLPKPSKSMQPQPCLLWKEANVSWNCPSQMLVFVIVLELSKLIRIMPLLINTAEEPTGKLFFDIWVHLLFSKNLVKFMCAIYSPIWKNAKKIWKKDFECKYCRDISNIKIQCFLWGFFFFDAFPFQPLIKGNCLYNSWFVTCQCLNTYGP